MTKKQQLQARRAQLLQELDAVEKELIATPAEDMERETDTDAEDTAFAAELKKDGKLEPPQPGTFIESNR